MPKINRRSRSHQVILPGKNVVTKSDRLMPDRKLNNQVKRLDREGVIAARAQQWHNALTEQGIEFVLKTYHYIKNIELTTADPALSERMAFLANGEAHLHASTRNSVNRFNGQR